MAEVDIRTSIRPTVAEVDLGAIRRNFDRVRRVVGSGVAIWGVVKADAYGHGAVAVGRALAPLCQGLAVSLVEEGLELRAAGIRLPILVLGAYYNRHQQEVLNEGLTPVIYDPADLDRFAAAASRRGKPAGVHIKVDTGMSRLGVSVAELPSVLDRVGAMPSIRLSGLATHLASADIPDGDTTVQALARFEACLTVARERGFTALLRHVANSAGALRYPQARYDAVRPGLALYGALPSRHVDLTSMEPALALRTRIMAVHDIAVGASVSYGGTWTAARPSRIATLPLGYADGYPRHVRGAEVLVRGERVPIVGAVCMDMLMVDVTDVSGATSGDAVTLIGEDAGQRISVDDLAGWAGTINYEILCGLSKRVPRIYRDSQRSEPPADGPPP